MPTVVRIHYLPPQQHELLDARRAVHVSVRAGDLVDVEESGSGMSAVVKVRFDTFTEA